MICVGSKPRLLLLIFLAQSVHAVQQPGYTQLALPAVVLAGHSLSPLPVAFTVAPHGDSLAGDLIAWRPMLNAEADAAGVGDSGYTEYWSARQRMAQAELTAADYWRSGRKIVTWDRESRTQVALRWSQLPVHLQRQLLGRSPVAGLDGPALIDYLRGDRSNELPAGLLPQRTSLFGDTLSSQPLYVESPASPHSAVVYVVTHNGTVHALDAATGSEQWAYMPSAVLSAAHQASATVPLWESAYTAPVTATVTGDGEVARQVLVGGLGGAATGWFALDVTKPEMAAESGQPAADRKVLWELNGRDDAGIGHFYGSPAVARMNDGQWYVVVGNGYNSVSAEAALYLIRIADGKPLRIGTGSGNAASPNGMSAPALVDQDLDGRIDTAYAGDSAGQLWKFDLGSAQVSEWKVAGKGLPLYTGTSLRPIMRAPEVTVHPEGGFLVYVATGHNRYVAGNAEAVNLIIALRDDIEASSLTENTRQSMVLLAPQSVRLGDSEVQVRRVSTVANTDSEPAIQWQLRLPAGLYPAASLRLRGGRLWVSLHDPQQRTNTRLALDYLHGGNPARPSFDLNNDNRANAADRAAANDIGVDIVGIEKPRGLWSAPVIVAATPGHDAHFSYWLSVNAIAAQDATAVAMSAPIVEIVAGPNFRPGRRSWIDITAD